MMKNLKTVKEEKGGVVSLRRLTDRPYFEGKGRICNNDSI